MAIRSGSGGLKYPLPNQAQLVAQQSAAAASAGGSAAASTFGANRAFAANKMRVQADLANSAADRQYRAMAQLEGQNFEAQQNFYDRENRKGAQLEAQRFDAEQQGQRFDQARELQWQNQYYNAEENRKERDFETGRDKARVETVEAARQREIGEQAAQNEANVQAGTMVLTPQAKQQMDTLDADRAKWATDQTMSPTQRAEAEQQYQDRKRRIMGTAVKAGPDATEQANRRQTFFDPKTGTYHKDMGPEGSGRIPGSVNEQGGFQPTVDNSKQQKDQERANAARQSELEKIAKDQEGELVGGPGGRTKTPQEAMESAKQIYAEREKAGYYGPVPGQQQPGGQPAPASELPPPDPGKGFFGNDPPRAADGTKIPTPPGQQPQVYNSAPGQTAQVPLPAGQPNAQSTGHVTGGGDSARQRSGSDIPGAAGITPDAFTKGWGSLPAGGVMYGPDGKLYTKK
jgi:hypothetical protein